MAKDNNNEKTEQQPKAPGAPFEAPRGDGADVNPEFTTTNFSNQNPDAPDLGPGSVNTKTAPMKASIVVAEPTQAATNQVQVKGGRYKKGNKLFNARGKEIDENGNAIDEN
jgi:hypothetical protein